jgi:hypothetical protein
MPATAAARVMDRKTVVLMARLLDVVAAALQHGPCRSRAATERTLARSRCIAGVTAVARALR